MNKKKKIVSLMDEIILSLEMLGRTRGICLCNFFLVSLFNVERSQRNDRPWMLIMKYSGACEKR